jgi:hypothetical protein
VPRIPGLEAYALWRKCIHRQADSGLTIAQFCTRECLSVTTFQNWKRRLRLIDLADRPSAAAPPTFLPVVESRCGAVVLGSAYLCPALSVAGASLAPKQALYINGLQYIASDHICEYETYLLLPGLSRPVLRFRFVSPHASLPFLCSAASRDRGIRTPTSVTGLSAQPALVQPLDQS